jgi:hypothetical protein
VGVSPLPEEVVVLRAFGLSGGKSSLVVKIPQGRRAIYSKVQQLRERGIRIGVEMTKPERLRRQALWAIPQFKAAHEAAVAKRQRDGVRSIRLQWQMDRCIIGKDVWAADCALPAGAAAAAADAQAAG